MLTVKHVSHEKFLAVSFSEFAPRLSFIILIFEEISTTRLRNPISYVFLKYVALIFSSMSMTRLCLWQYEPSCNGKKSFIYNITIIIYLLYDWIKILSIMNLNKCLSHFDLNILCQRFTLWTFFLFQFFSWTLFNKYCMTIRIYNHGGNGSSLSPTWGSGTHVPQ